MAEDDDDRQRPASQPSDDQQNRDRHDDRDRERTRDDGEGRDRSGGKDGGKKDDGDKRGGNDDDEARDDDKQDQEDDGPPIYKRPLFWIIFAVVAAVLIIGGILWWLHARRFESSDDAFVDAHIVRIAAQSSGKLIRVVDADNRHVAAGQILAVVEPYTPEAQLAEARAGVIQAGAQVLQAQAQVDTAVAQRRQAEANAAAPAADAAKAARDYARYQTLQRIDAQAAAQSQVDQARATAESTAAQALAARRQVTSAEAQVKAAEKNVTAARAQVKAAQARVQQANVTINDLVLKAPVSGQVVNRQVNLGSYVGPGTQLMALVPDQMWITANFKETQLTLMRLGQHVAIKVDAFPGVKFVGHVDSIQRGAGQAFAVLPPQNATGNYVKVVQRVPVRILFDIGGGRPDPRNYPIGPGMSAVPTVTVR
ncbi:MAG: HlyD family secretion protein [Sphingomonadaceae bacterium]|nr:HlyD family secretion protein [Sphingomonadaceae bacterium]